MYDKVINDLKILMKYTINDNFIFLLLNNLKTRLKINFLKIE